MLSKQDSVVAVSPAAGTSCLVKVPKRHVRQQNLKSCGPCQDQRVSQPVLHLRAHDDQRAKFPKLLTFAASSVKLQK